MDSLVDTLVKQTESFIENAKKTTNKSAARRARKISLELTKTLKEYRRLSVK